MAFVKIHGEILDSSVWALPHATRIVWVTMLAMADENGIVNASVDGLARRAVVALAECEAALEAFTGPDKHSRDGTTGERIEKVSGGWLILNHAQYRDKRTQAQIQNAIRVARHREKQKSAEGNDVTPGNGKPRPEAEAEAEAEASPNTRPPAADEPEGWTDFWTAYPKKQAKAKSLVAFRRLSKADRAAALADVRVRATSADWTKAGGQYVPLATTYLHGRRWEDRPTVVAAPDAKEFEACDVCRKRFFGVGRGAEITVHRRTCGKPQETPP